MVSVERHEGGCSCGAVRYRTKGTLNELAYATADIAKLEPVLLLVFQFISRIDNIELIQGILNKYEFKNRSGRTFVQEFCPKCATTLFWSLEVFQGMTGIAGGSFDPPTFWYKIDREVFCRTSAAWINNDIDEKHDTHPNYEPINTERDALRY